METDFKTLPCIECCQVPSSFEIPMPTGMVTYSSPLLHSLCFHSSQQDCKGWHQVEMVASCLQLTAYPLWKPRKKSPSGVMYVARRPVWQPAISAGRFNQVWGTKKIKHYTWCLITSLFKWVAVFLHLLSVACGWLQVLSISGWFLPPATCTDNSAHHVLSFLKRMSCGSHHNIDLLIVYLYLPTFLLQLEHITVIDVHILDYIILGGLCCSMCIEDLSICSICKIIRGK